MKRILIEYKYCGKKFIIKLFFGNYSQNLIAHECGLEVGELIYTGADVHIYSNHVEQVKEQMTRAPKALPTIKLNTEKQSVFDFELEDIELIGYDPHPSIKAPVAV